MAMRARVLLGLLLLAGCSTVPQEAEKYTRDGRQFGVVRGTFRAQWWDFYERGRSYLDGGFLAEAEADLRTAVRLRPRDQRWARTYGLHFLPEYFPNRELGMVCYRQGRLEEAARLLEVSLRDEASALAAHYLNLARMEAIERAGGDHAPPTITAHWADDSSGLLVVEVRDDHYVARAEVNGEAQLVDLAQPALRFSRKLALRAGENKILIRALDLAGNESVETITLRADADGPALSFDTLSTVISGWASDPSGIAEIRFGDTLAVLEEEESGRVRFHAEIAARAAGPIPFAARDARGNESTGVLAAEDLRAAAARPLQVAGNMDAGWIAAMLARLQLAQAAPQDTPQLRFTNLADGQRYLMDEIVVSVEARSPGGIAALRIDGTPVEGLVAGAKNLHLSRRLLLGSMGEHTITAELVDGAGNRATTEVHILRVPTAIENPEERLRMALLGSLWEGAGQRLEEEAQFVEEELARTLFQRRRFDLVSRDLLPRVLEENELRAALGNRAVDPGLRSLLAADVFAVGKIRRTGESMEIIVQAVSSESARVLAYADVAGNAATMDALRGLARDLALRLEQEFPKVAGDVVQLSGNQCFTTLSEADRIRADLPCVVYRMGPPIVHPDTGTLLGHAIEILARGTIAEVRPQLSRIALSGGAETIQVHDHVATR